MNDWHSNIGDAYIPYIDIFQGRNAFFQELHSHPYIPNQNTDMTIAIVQKQVL